MDWQSLKKGFRSYMKLERSLSGNSVEAYIHDLDKLLAFFEIRQIQVQPEQVNTQQLRDFIAWINELGMTATSQARILSGIKSFYKYLLMEDLIKSSPAELIEAPKTRRKLPDTLNPEEINALIEAIDLSKPDGARNKAILETLYGCGLRVSELTDLKISNLLLNLEFIRVRGKGDKERLIPIGSEAIKYIEIYRKEVRVHYPVKAGFEDFLFLNQRGSKLSRVMIFLIIKELAKKINLQKTISPHTFRHSFASHLVEGGADLRAVQEMLGHESITTTEIYTHLDRDYLRSTIMQYHPRS